jgi:hypothetical protein
MLKKKELSKMSTEIKKMSRAMSGNGLRLAAGPFPDAAGV